MHESKALKQTYKHVSAPSSSNWNNPTPTYTHIALSYSPDLHTEHVVSAYKRGQAEMKSKFTPVNFAVSFSSEKICKEVHAAAKPLSSEIKQLSCVVSHIGKTSLCCLTLLRAAYFKMETYPSSTLPFNHCRPIQSTDLWKHFCLLSWRLQPPHGRKKTSLLVNVNRRAGWPLLISYLDMFQSRSCQANPSAQGQLVLKLLFSSVPKKINFRDHW